MHAHLQQWKKNSSCVVHTALSRRGFCGLASVVLPAWCVCYWDMAPLSAPHTLISLIRFAIVSLKLLKFYNEGAATLQRRLIDIVQKRKLRKDRLTCRKNVCRTRMSTRLNRQRSRTSTDFIIRECILFWILFSRYHSLFNTLAYLRLKIR